MATDILFQKIIIDIDNETYGSSALTVCYRHVARRIIWTTRTFLATNFAANDPDFRWINVVCSLDTVLLFRFLCIRGPFQYSCAPNRNRIDDFCVRSIAKDH